MIRYSIGSTIRDLRVEEGLSQEELCFGICSVSNLSKIENETRVPNRVTFEALMQRLGKDVSFYMIFMSKKEADQAQLFQKAISNIFFNNYTQVKDIFLKLKELENELNNNLFEQEMAFIKCILDQYYYYKDDDYLKRYKSILSLSECKCDPEFIRTHRFTYVEISIMIYIVEEVYQRGNILDAIDILKSLEQYINQKVCTDTLRAKMIQVILYLLSKYYFEIDRFNDSLEYAEKGLELCEIYDHLWVFPAFLCYKGLVLEEIGKKEQSRKCLEQSCGLFEMLGSIEAMQEIKNLMLKK